MWRPIEQLDIVILWYRLTFLCNTIPPLASYNETLSFMLVWVTLATFGRSMMAVSGVISYTNLSTLPWTFPGAPLKFYGLPEMSRITSQVWIYISISATLTPGASTMTSRERHGDAETVSTPWCQHAAGSSSNDDETFVTIIELPYFS